MSFSLATICSVQKAAMNAFQVIANQVVAEPFHPFRIQLTNGQTFEIRDPDAMILGHTTFSFSTVSSWQPKNQWTKVLYDEIEAIDLIEPLPPQTSFKFSRNS